MILILAGDIVANIPTWMADPKKDFYTPWLKSVVSRFRAVIYVGGNHEAYKGSIARSFDYLNYLADEIRSTPNAGCLHVLENQIVEIGGIRFIGTTKWTPLDTSSDLREVSNMSDMHVIAEWTTPKWQYAYKVARSFLETTLNTPFDGETVVVTHHAPSFQSVIDEYRDSDSNGLFASNEDDLMLDHAPTLWIHGHMHSSIDYVVTSRDGVECTRVVCNPYGYHDNDTNDNYNNRLVVEL